MQINNAAGLTFEKGLRALLRQDPDIIMVGETRDGETASISVRAAITGHLVLSSLHTNDAISTINTFFQTTQQYLAALNQRPEISMAYSTFDVRYPQWTVEVDASKCKRAGITPDQVLSTLSGYYGGQYVSNFNRFSKVYKVMI